MIKKLPSPYNRYGVLLNEKGDMQIISKDLNVMTPVKHKFAGTYNVYRLLINNEKQRQYVTEQDIKNMIGE